MSRGDFFINDIQINNDKVDVDIAEVNVTQSFNNSTNRLPSRENNIIHPISSLPDSLTFRISLIRTNNGTFSDLLSAEKTIMSEITKQVELEKQTLLSHSASLFYFDSNEELVFFGSPSFESRGVFGNRIIELTFNCSIGFLYTD